MGYGSFSLNTKVTKEKQKSQKKKMMQITKTISFMEFGSFSLNTKVTKEK